MKKVVTLEDKLMDKYIEKALIDLTDIVNINMLHPTDEDRIKVTLRTLHKHNIAFDIDAIDDWLENNNWAEIPRKNFVGWATSISNGKSVRLKFKDTTIPTEEDIWTFLNS